MEKPLIVMGSHMRILYTIDCHAKIDMYEKNCKICGGKDKYIGDFYNVEELLADEGVKYYDEKYVRKFFNKELEKRKA